MKYSKRVYDLLVEAVRREQIGDSHEKAKPLDQKWLGLGTAAAYRPVLEAGLMVYFDGEVPPRGCKGWLVLTEAGVKAFKEIKRQVKIPEAATSGILAYQLAGGLARR